jgi:hypothetical protein
MNIMAFRDRGSVKKKWKIGRMEDWKDGRLERWKIGKMEDWKDGCISATLPDVTGLRRDLARGFETN